MKKHSFFVFHLISILILSLSLGNTSWAVMATVRGAASDNLKMGVVGDFDGDGDQNLIVCSGNVNLNVADDCEAGVDAVEDDPYDPYDAEVEGVEGSDPYDTNCNGYLDVGAAGYYANPFTGGRDFVYAYDDNYDPKIPANAVIHGNEDNDYFAQTCANVGDVTGDGVDDVAFGTYSKDNGYVYLMPGNSSLGNGFTDINTMLDAEEAYQYTGESSSSYTGYSIAPAGDFNGDGTDDFVVGAYYDDEGASNAGAVYVILGSATPSGDLTAEIKYTGEAASDYVGRSVSGGYDINADGFDDIVVGAYGDDDGGSSAGAAYIIFGSASPTGGSLASEIKYTGEASSDYAGRSVANLGDTNADGFADVLIGADGNDDNGSSAGAAYLILGSASLAGGSLSTADVEFKGKAAGDYAGYSVAGVGDVNADGRNDFLIGAPYNDDAASNAGAAYLIKGRLTYPSAQITLPGAATVGNYFLGVATSAEGFGNYVGSAGDFDGDGRDDIIIGAPYNDEGGGSAGKVWVITAPMLFPRGASVR